MKETPRVSYDKTKLVFTKYMVDTDEEGSTYARSSGTLQETMHLYNE